jgi:hypothetical protein
MINMVESKGRDLRCPGSAQHHGMVTRHMSLSTMSWHAWSYRLIRDCAVQKHNDHTKCRLNGGTHGVDLECDMVIAVTGLGVRVREQRGQKSLQLTKMGQRRETGGDEWSLRTWEAGTPQTCGVDSPRT